MINNKKTLLLFAVFFIILSISITFMLRYTFLTVKITGEDNKTVYISDSSGNIKQQYDTTSSSKRFLLKRDSYNIKAIDKERTSTYIKSLKAFSFNVVSLELKDQKESVYIGKSNLKCSKFVNNSPIYYSCNPSSASLISTTELSDVPINTGENSLKPTFSGFIKAEINSANLQISNLSNSEELTGDKVTIKNFGLSLNDDDLSISNSRNGFSINSRTASKLYVFKDYNDKNPLQIDTSKKNQGLHIKTISGNRYTYLIVFNNDNHSHGEVSLEQEINIYDNKTGELVSKKSLPSSWFINEISDTYEDNFIIVASTEGVRNTYLYKGLNKSYEEINIDSSSLQNVCWVDSNSFYYVSDYEKSIYKYSIDSRSSYLIYKGLAGNALINNVGCYDKKINFTIYSDIRQDIDNYYHYTINDDTFSGIRVESVLPLYFNTEINSYQAVEDRNGIKLIPYNPAAGDLNSAITTLKGLLKENGVESLDKINVF